MHILQQLRQKIGLKMTSTTHYRYYTCNRCAYLSTQKDQEQDDLIYCQWCYEPDIEKWDEQAEVKDD
jgi:hypothetical protein